MEHLVRKCSTSLLGGLICLYMLFLISKVQGGIRQRAENRSISAVLVFGDSSVDAGNNNYIQTLLKCNFLPYGRDFPNKTPTGRFSNGRLATDFIASYLGVKHNIPPYLDPNLSIKELKTGVSFASGGSGLDPFTPELSGVIDMQEQLEDFRKYKKRLVSAIGKQKTEDHINKALFIISAGTNDFTMNYFTVPIRRENYTVPAYQEFLIKKVKEFIQDLSKLGARRITVNGLPPMGCLPVVITLNSQHIITERGCIQHYSFVAKDYNMKLEKELKGMNKSLANAGTRIYFTDIYKPIDDMIKGYKKFGFTKVAQGCCGTGYVEASYLCLTSFVCPDASKYVFWDAIHPTEKAYYNVFRSITPILDVIKNSSHNNKLI